MIHPIHWAALFVLLGIAVWLNVTPPEQTQTEQVPATLSTRQAVIGLALSQVGKPRPM